MPTSAASLIGLKYISLLFSSGAPEHKTHTNGNNASELHGCNGLGQSCRPLGYSL